MTIYRTYERMIEYPSFEDRFEYLCLGGRGGILTFGSARYLNQLFYRSQEWKDVRNEVIVRDNGCDLGVDGHEINGTVYVHHINPITKEDIYERRGIVLDPSNLVCVTYPTHKALHYGNMDMLSLSMPVERTPNDTCPWKGGRL